MKKKLSTPKKPSPMHKASVAGVQGQSNPSQSKAVIKVRRISNKHYNKIESTFNKSFSQCEKLEGEINELELLINKREILIPSDKASGTPTIKRLNPFQISGYKKQLHEKRAMLKYAKLAMKSSGSAYKAANTRNSISAKSRIKNFNERMRLSRKALRSIEEIKTFVNQIVTRLTNCKDARITSLKAEAISNGRKFYTDFQKLLRNEIFDSNVKGMISASASVRTQLANMVRSSFGWVKK